MEYINYSRFLWDMFWLIPCILGIGSITYVFYIRKRRSKLTTLLITFSLSLFLLLIGFLGSWRAGYEIWVIVGAAHDISIDLMYRGWKNSWQPIYISGFFSIVLYAFAVVVHFQKQHEIIKTKEREHAVLLSIMPAILAISLILLIVTSHLIDISEFPFYIYPLMIILLFSYYLVPFLGIPYLLYWGYKINKYRTNNGKDSAFWVMIVLFFLSIPLILFHTYWWIYTINHGSNPIVPYHIW